MNEAYRSLSRLNGDFLLTVRQECQTARIRLLFGSNGIGDFLCLTEDGSVVFVYAHAPVDASPVADSLDTFFDDICMGPGYVRLFQPRPDDFWFLVLQEFGFLEANGR